MPRRKSNPPIKSRDITSSKFHDVVPACWEDVDGKKTYGVAGKLPSRQAGSSTSPPADDILFWTCEARTFTPPEILDYWPGAPSNKWSKISLEVALADARTATRKFLSLAGEYETVRLISRDTDVHDFNARTPVERTAPSPALPVTEVQKASTGKRATSGGGSQPTAANALLGLKQRPVAKRARAASPSMQTTGRASSNKYVLGIDLGNTTTYAYFILLGDDRSWPEPLMLNPLHNAPTMPSVVLLMADGTVHVGQAAIDFYRPVEKQVFVSNHKQYMGYHFPHSEPVPENFIRGHDGYLRVRSPDGNTKYPLEAFSAFLLSHVMSIFNEIDTDSELVCTVLGCPNVYSSQQCQRLLDAAELAGFNRSSVKLTSEPLCGVASFFHPDSKAHPGRPLNKVHRILAFDPGGSTSDTLRVHCEYSAEHKTYTLKAVWCGGVPVAGEDITKSLMQMHLSAHPHEGATDIRQLAPSVYSALFQCVETGKKHFSLRGRSGRTSAILEYLPDLSIGYHTYNPEEVKTHTTPVLMRMTAPVTQLHKDFRSAPKRTRTEQVVLLMGGSSRFPWLVNGINNKDMDGRTMVQMGGDVIAKGAVWLAKGIAEPATAIVNIEDTVSHTIGVMSDPPQNGRTTSRPLTPYFDEKNHLVQGQCHHVLFKPRNPRPSLSPSCADDLVLQPGTAVLKMCIVEDVLRLYADNPEEGADPNSRKVVLAVARYRDGVPAITLPVSLRLRCTLDDSGVVHPQVYVRSGALPAPQIDYYWRMSDAEKAAVRNLIATDDERDTASAGMMSADTQPLNHSSN